MNLHQIARLAVARLGLPMPMAKLVTIHAIAKALDDESTAAPFADALAEWASSCKLESQCLEAICPLIVATRGRDMVDRIRRAIARPSLASDLLLSITTGNPILVAAWAGCHSNPAPKLLAMHEEECALRAGTFIPPLFTHLLEELQELTGRPFMRQWAFEYSVLAGRYSEHEDGHLSYFFGSDREHVGQFVARRSTWQDPPTFVRLLAPSSTGRYPSLSHSDTRRRHLQLSLFSCGLHRSRHLRGLT